MCKFFRMWPLLFYQHMILIWPSFNSDGTVCSDDLWQEREPWFEHGRLHIFFAHMLNVRGDSLWPILELIQTLKECLFCHIYCAQLCAHMRAIVTVSCAVSNRESRYPRRRYENHEIIVTNLASRGWNLQYERGVARTVLEKVSCSTTGTWTVEPLRGGCTKQLADIAATFPGTVQ